MGKRNQVHNQNDRVESLCDRLYASLACVTARIGTDVTTMVLIFIIHIIITEKK